MKNYKLFISLIATMCLISCNNENNYEVKHGKVTHKEISENKNKPCEEVHWVHEGQHGGPEEWTNLCDGYVACGGEVQSPINIVTSISKNKNALKAPNFKYGDAKVNIVNNGHTIQFNIEGDHKVNINGKNYNLLQFHFHALSEHTIDGKNFPLEVHFVHQYSNEDYVVLGVMFEPGAENAMLNSYLNRFPTNEGVYQSDEYINLKSLLPKNKSYYHYNGSLTTPPCSEVVSWYIIKNPVEASKKQLEEFALILNKNYRPTMPINDREVVLYVE